MISQITKNIKQIVNFFKKTSIWCKATIIIIIVLLCTTLVNRNQIQIEAFTQDTKFVVKNNNSLWDDFYCSIYDDLVYDDKKNDFEVTNIDRIGKINKNSNILDIGCGKGHHVKHYTASGNKVQGIDKSAGMIKCARKKYPECKFINDDVLKSMTYQPKTFTHALALYFTLYYVEDKHLFFKNVYDWLKPGGILVVHLVNRDKFDPILNVADPLVMVSAQKYAKKRITNSNAKFKDFVYKANFQYEKNNNKSTFTETFTDDATKHVRQNEHTLYMEKQKDILSKAKKIGFILQGKVDMTQVQYEYQYLYFLKKPE
jgi:ubiquinone/menaquinone biosynthesis C-methylase UbiE